MPYGKTRARQPAGTEIPRVTWARRRAARRGAGGDP